MITAKYSDKQVIVDILSQAFDTNKSVNYVVLQDKKRPQRIKRLMEYSFEVCWNFGEIYFSDDRKAVALLVLPEKKKFSLKSIYEDIKLALFSVGISRASKILARESKIKKYHPQNFMYLWYVGVEPINQGKGYGSHLLKEIIQLSIKRNLPIYLETSTVRNLPLYNRLNFITYEKLNFDYTLHLMKREPSLSV